MVCIDGPNIDLPLANNWNPVQLDENGVCLHVETFSHKSDPSILPIMREIRFHDVAGNDSCKELAGRCRFGIHYDQRDTGESAYYPDNRL